MPAAPATQPNPKMGMRLMRGRQTHAINQARVERRAGDARDRDHEQGVDILGGKARAHQSPAERLLAKLLGTLNPGIVGLPPGCHFVIRVNRQRQKAAINFRVRMHPVHHLGVIETPFPDISLSAALRNACG